MWTITDSQYLASRGFDVLVFHNDYYAGKSAGLELIHHGIRTAMRGDVSLLPLPHDGVDRPRLLSREPLAQGLGLVARLHYPKEDFRYSVTVRPDGGDIRVIVALENAPAAVRQGAAVFHLFLFPDVYCGKPCLAGEQFGLIPPQYSDSLTLAGGRAGVLARGRTIQLAPDDPACALTIRSLAGELELVDGSALNIQIDPFVRSALALGRPEAAAHWVLSPARVPNWLKPVEIQINQVGYHPAQRKLAVLELDPADHPAPRLRLVRLRPHGREEEVLAAEAKPFGRHLRCAYAHFDFTAVRAPGLYRVYCGDRCAGPFRIAEDVYDRGVWQPTLETFLPVQMCHVEVRDRERIWHGACHLDDAVQAPAGTKHFDGYWQSETTDSPFKDLEPLPGVNEGGWHDAGDFDLVGGSQSHTTLTLALIAQTFGVDHDTTTVLPKERLVRLHRPDGVPDILQQVAHGAKALLGPYEACGHGIFGIIEACFEQYAVTGDPVSATAGMWSAAAGPAPGAGVIPKGPRWVFTTRVFSFAFRMVSALAAAARVLKTHDPELAKRCLAAAESAFDDEVSRLAASPPTKKNEAHGARADAAAAAAELLLATGKERYRRIILEGGPVLVNACGRVGGRLAQALEELGHAGFKAELRGSAAQHAADLAARRKTNPYGILWRSATWGIAWGLLRSAMNEYFLWRAFPDVIDAEGILSVVNYALGCHPGPSVSLVSGVGARSAAVAYGFNRDDWSYIAGGVASGPSHILPDLLEFREGFPFLWTQKEYVIHGSADFMFCVLAASDILGRRA